MLKSFRPSLRQRLAIAFAILTICSLLALSVSLFLSTEEREEQLIDEIVNTALDRLVAQWPIEGHIFLPKNLQFLYAPIGQTPAGLPAEIARYAVGNTEYFEGEHEFHVGVREHDGLRFYVLYDTKDHELRLQNEYAGVGVAVLILSLCALALGYILAGTILRQLSKLTDVIAQDLPLDQDFSQDREIALLANTIRLSREENAKLLQREREFTAHVGHELRTPLTRIRTSAELLAELAHLSAADLRRVQQIESAADEMQARLTALLFLARDLRALNVSTVSLFAAVEHCLHNFSQQKPEIARHNLIDTQQQISADPQLLAMLLDNLVGNALRYTPSGQITISWRDGALCVADTGEGIVDQPRMLQAFERGSDLPDGFGLGLAIVGRICDALSWQCLIDSQAGQGTIMMIVIEHAPGNTHSSLDSI